MKPEPPGSASGAGNRGGPFRRKSLFVRLFASFALLAVLPVVALGLVSYVRAARALESQTARGNEASLLVLRRTLEERVANIYRLLYRTAYDSSLVAYMKAGPGLSVEDVIESGRINDLLRRQRDGDDLVRDIFVFFPSARRVVTSGALFQADAFFGRVYRFGDDRLTGEAPRVAVKPSIVLLSDVQYMRDDGGQLLSLPALMATLPLGAAQPRALAAILLDGTRLEEILGRSDAASQAACLLVDVEGRTVARAGPLLTGDFDPSARIPRRELAEIASRVESSGTSSGSFQARSGREPAIVAYTHVAQTPWALVSVTPARLVMAPSMEIRRLTVAFGLILIAAVLAAAFALSGRLYRPVSRMTEMLRAWRGPGTATAENELEDIASALTLAYEETRRLDAAAGAALPVLRERFFCRLARGLLGPASEVQARMDDLELAFVHGRFTVLAVRIDGEVDAAERLSHVMFFGALKRLGKAVEETAGEGMTAHVFFEERSTGAILNHDWDRQRLKERVRLMAQEIREVARSDLGLSVSMGVGSTVGGPQRVPRSYEDAMDALKLTLFRGRSQLCFHDEARRPGEGLLHFPIGEESRLANLLQTGDWQTAERSMRRIVEGNLEANGENYGLVNQLFRELIGVAIRVLYEVGRSPREALGPMADVYGGFSRQETVGAAVSYIGRLYRAVAQAAARSADARRAAPIVAYIREHFREDIPLEQVAAVFHVSAGHFCRQFREMTGRRFLDYLNGYRIEEARKLMQNDGTHPIGDLPGTVGFRSYKSFSRAFKRYTGVAPEKYRSRVAMRCAGTP